MFDALVSKKKLKDALSNALELAYLKKPLFLEGFSFILKVYSSFLTNHLYQGSLLQSN